jgi:hypothetical protein
LHRYIKDKLHWVLHAPRQTGKATFLKSWMREINAGGDTLACYGGGERTQGIRVLTGSWACRLLGITCRRST